MSKSPAPERLNHLPEAAMQSSFSTVRAYLHVIVFFALTLGTGFLSPPGITEMGMNILGVFLGLLYGWSFIGFAWPSMICLVALGFTLVFITEYFVPVGKPVCKKLQLVCHFQVCVHQ